MNKSRTFVTYPLVWYYAYRSLLYLALLIGPAMLTEWLASAAPESIRGFVQFIAYALVLPALYWGLYEFLRRSGARSQSFIYLIIIFFAMTAGLQFHSAVTKGGFGPWISGLVMILYVAGFIWIAIRGAKRNRADAEAAYQAQQEEKIYVQTQAILRARSIEEAATKRGQ